MKFVVRSTEIHYLCSMNEFSTCIEYLLLNHNCVIVPGFGAFLAQQMDSRKSETDEAFLPPYRTVRFNQDLQEGDDFFINSLKEIYRVTTPRAQKMLLEWTSEFHQTMEEQEEVEFGSIGRFTLNEGNLIFNAFEAGITTTEYYGLDAFHVEQLILEDNLEEKPVKITRVQADDKQITIRINRRIVNYLSAAVAAIIFLMVFSTPVENSEIATINQENAAQLFMPSNLIYSASTMVVEEEPVIISEKPDTNKVVSEVQEEVVPEVKPIESKPEPRYCIVLASAVSEKNGNAYVADLQGRGYNDAQILVRGTMRRVVITGFQTEEEASAKVRELHQLGAEFESAWVMNL